MAALLEARSRPAAARKRRSAPEKAESPFVETGQAWLSASRNGVVLSLAMFALVALSQGLSKPVLGSRDTGAVPYSFELAPADPDLLSSGARATAWPIEDEGRPSPHGSSPPDRKGSALPDSSAREGKAGPVKEAAPAAAESGTASGPIATASRERRPQGPFATRSDAGGDAGRHGIGVKRRTSVAIEEEKIVTKQAAPRKRVLTTEPEVTFRPRPVYPPSAVKKELEGTVRVKFLVTTTGSVKNLEVLWAEPPGPFEVTVKEAVSQWRFVPGKDQDGKPMEAEQVYTYRFVLEAAGA